MLLVNSGEGDAWAAASSARIVCSSTLAPFTTSCGLVNSLAACEMPPTDGTKISPDGHKRAVRTGEEKRRVRRRRQTGGRLPLHARRRRQLVWHLVTNVPGLRQFVLLSHDRGDSVALNFLELNTEGVLFHKRHAGLRGPAREGASVGVVSP